MVQTVNAANTIVGFIGLGVMGKPMARNLIRAGYRLKVYDLFPEKAGDLVAEGAEMLASPAEVAKASDVIISMINDAPNLREVLFGENGCVHEMRAGQVYIDSSTISPTEVRRCSAKLAEKGAHMLDAPVSGGEKGAIEATLTIMVGGDEEILNAVMPILTTLGTTITYMGKTGSGQVTKLGNNLMLAINTLGACEGMILAAHEGLDLDKYLNAVLPGTGSTWTLREFGAGMTKHDFRGSFPVRLMRKDLRLVSETVAEENLALPGSALVLQLYNSVAADDMNKGFESLLLALEKLNGFRVDHQE